MAWLALIAVLALIAISASFRKLAAVVAILCVVAGLAIWLYSSHQSRQYAQNRDAARRKIQQSAISLTGLSLNSTYGSSYDLTGRLANLATADSVAQVGLKVMIYDCPNGEVTLSACARVGDDDALLLETVPPGQARDFRAYVRLPDALRIRGQMKWTYEVTYVQATSP